MTMEEETVKHKSHRERNSGRKAEKKKTKNKANQESTGEQRNAKAFAINSAVKAERRFRRKQDIDTKKTHIPLVDRTPVEPPPILVAVVGPPKVGKSLLIQCLIKSYTRQRLSKIIGPVTIVSGKNRRITFMECNNDLNSMIDMAKVADLVLLLIDGSFGFEMEVLEFLNICQVHGMPRIMGVLTHLDLLSNGSQLSKTKKALKHRFWTEVYDGAKLFYLSGLIHEEYLSVEIKNLARFISVMKFRPLTWRTTHPYMLADRIEDLTPPETIRQTPKVDRTISFYGFVRGGNFTQESYVHIAGCGDYRIKHISALPDPCPLPKQQKKRALTEKEKPIYAPISGVGGVLYDKDAVYIELGGSHSHKEDDSRLVSSLIDVQETLDQKLEHSELQIFSDGAPIKSRDVEETLNKNYSQENVLDNGRIRRKVVFKNAEKEKDSEEFLEESDEEPMDDENENIDQGDEEEFQIVIGGKRKSSIDGNPQDSRKHCKRDVADELEEELVALRGQHKQEKDQNQDKSNKMNDDESESELDEEKQESSEKDLIYKEPVQNSDKIVKNKIAEALKRLDTTPDPNKSQSNSDDEDFDDSQSFDELSDNDISENSEDDDDNLKWKTDLAEKAREAFLNRQQNRVNLMKLVYGESTKEGNENIDNQEAEEDVGGMFRMITEQQKKVLQERELKNQEESLFFSQAPPRNWLSDENKSLIVNRFVTGKWKDSEDAEELLKLDALVDDDEEIHGDFEDLETGEKFETKNQQSTEKSNPDDAEKKKQLLEKKRKLKQQFDAEYDNSESKTYFDELKEEVERQAQLNKSEFAGLDDEIRIQLEGFRPGMYVRVEIESVPCELITNFNPTYPLILGGLLHGEENIGFVQCRMKLHRWYPRILKTRNPLIFSVGWRRFQTLPIFAKLEDNMRQRMLKYTPKHFHCMVHFWGPITPQGTGVLALQDVSMRSMDFRIAATGSIVELSKSTCVMKKLKLIGEPLKIYKKTAFIKGMFNSDLEVAKFIGAKIKTVSGIRGQIKKAESKPAGCFRASFEDKIMLSDIVFCRTWFKVDVPKFYNPVTSLLLEEKNQWRGMKTIRELKKENAIKAEPAKDSLYTAIERKPKIYQPLIVPKSLQKELPYRDKPKLKPRLEHRKIKFADKRVAVVRSAKEEKEAKLMQMIRVNYSNKQLKMKEEMRKRMTDYQSRVEAEEMKKFKRHKELKKQVFRTLSKMDAKESKKGGR